MRKTLEITLYSDLCAGVGKHYASVIDLDTALDEQGLPYIPARRLKGCLRQVAEFINIPNVNSIFGVSGNDTVSSFKISDAVIENYEDTVKVLRENHIPHYEVTDLFCSVRKQTAIDSETGTAKERSLRFTRVVNRTFPESDLPMKFYATVSFSDSDEETIKKVCKALKNIGYQRNRGLGCVECALTDYENSFVLDEKEFDDETEYELSYTLYTEGDLMLPDTDSSHSTDYIHGTTILGALAGKYKGNGFEEIFLSAKVKFGNLYISDHEHHKFMPSPKFLAKIKAPVTDEDKAIINILGVCMESADKPYKVLKKGYVSQKYGEKKPERKIVYHNSINTTDGGLYMQYCLCKGQYFTGKIVAEGRYMKEIYPLFADGYFRIGRSKTAQYSLCRIISPKTEKRQYRKKIAEENSVIAFVLNSDVILTDENGNFSADVPLLTNTMLDTLGIDRNALMFSGNDPYTDKTAVSVKTISGYNAKWNLVRPQITAFSSGSTVIAKVIKPVELPECFILGEKQNEGYGEVQVIFSADKFQINQGKPQEENLQKISEKQTGEMPKNEPFQNCMLLDMIYRQRQKELLRLPAIQKATELIDDTDNPLNSTQISRVLMMSKEADSFENFEARINSIKTDAVREKVLKYFSADVIRKEVTTIFSEECTWQQGQIYLNDCLTVCKYMLRKGSE